MGPTGPLILVPTSNGHLGMPTLPPFQWLPQQQVQQPQPMETTVTTVASNSVTMTATTPKKTQPLFVTMNTTAQTTPQQQTTIDSFNEKHLDVEEHFRRSLGMLHNTSGSSTKDSTQPNTNTVTITQATSTPNQPTLYMPAVQTPPTTNPMTSLQQHIALANNKTQIFATQQKENVTMASEVGGCVASVEVAMPTPTKPQNVINNPLNIENLIATNTTSNTVTTQPTSSQAFEPSGHEQHKKSADIQVATNTFPTIFLAPGGMYPQTAAAATGLPFISMDPNLLGTVLVPSQLAAAQQANQAALLQGGIKLTNEDVIKMIQAQTSSSAIGTPAVGATTENSTDASNAVMAMFLQQQQRAGVKPIYLVDSSDGAQQKLRSISGSNIITMATTMDNGSSSTSNSLSAQNSLSQIVPTPMNTNEGSGQVMETSQPVTNERRSVHSDFSSISEQVEDHFTRALGNKWQLTQKF